MSAKLDNTCINRDMSHLIDEVINHLFQAEDADVEISLEVNVATTIGILLPTVRMVTENCKTLQIAVLGSMKEILEGYMSNNSIQSQIFELFVASLSANTLFTASETAQIRDVLVSSANADRMVEQISTIWEAGKDENT